MKLMQTKNIASIKLKGGALQFVVFTGLVIAILLAAFVSLTHVHSLFKKQTGLTIATIKNTDFGIYTSINSNINLLNTAAEDSNIIETKKEFWGIYEKVITTSVIKKNRFTKVALVGGITNNRTALYLKESNQPLIVVGDTKIEGTSFIPKQGIKAGNISGNSYYGTNLVYGNTKESSRELPKPINLKQFEHEKFDLSTFKNEQLISFKLNTSYSNSFLEPTKLLYEPTSILLSEIQLIGNIIIQSESTITVDASAKLKDIILIAPKIEILDNVKGNFQAIASESITVGKNCILEYPSALLLKSTPNNDSKNDSHHLYFGSSSTCKGIIAYLGESTQKRFKPQLIIEENATVYGEVFCEANTELKGTVYGSLYTSRFISSTLGSIYLNHIFNGKIIAPSLPDQYAGLSFNNDKKDIAKWLY
ncbi:hypothetical protein GTQ40_13690 [Flavobacteriaceae bacterium R38]|nr:hypothetical protein [Flavobacteriaceae bacterium R38]